MNKHDRYLEELCEQLEDDYDLILKNIPLLSKKRRRVAEIDILAIKGDKCDVYEVKCSYRKTKAKRQLEKIRKLLEIRHCFLFCGESGKIEAI